MSHPQHAARPADVPSGSDRAERGVAREILEIAGASHVVGISHPRHVPELIARALKATQTGSRTITQHAAHV